MAKRGRIRQLWRWFAPNPIWELVKWIAGSSIMTSIGRFFWLEFHRSPVDWWWLGCLLLSGLLLAGLAFWKERKLALGSLNPQGDNEVFRTTVKEWSDRHNTNEVVKAGIRSLDLFTQLQVDVISFAMELAKFSREMHERPDFVLPKYQDSVAGTVARVEFLQRRNAIIESTYRQRFGDRLKQIVDRLGAEGVKRPFLDSRVSGDINEAIEAQTTATHLVGAAFELNELFLYPPRRFTTFDLDTMSGDEMARRIREEPGFAETLERYRMKNLIVRD